MNLYWCRLCVNVVDDTSAQNIFDNIILLKEIEDLIGIKLKNDANLPQFICEDCELNVEACCKFRVRCLRAQNYFCSEKFKERTIQFQNVVENKVNDKNLVEIVEETNVDIEEVYVDTESLDLENMDYIDETYNAQATTEEDERANRPFLLYDKKPTLEKKQTPKTKNNKTYVCEICGHLFTAQNHYHYHMRRHLGDKRHQCKYCPSKFVGSTELKVHMRRHTGEKPYPCAQCERKFTCESHRKRHERALHTNIRPHKCIFCEKSYTSVSALKKHLMIHSDNRPFTCTVCDKSFIQRNNFLAHCKSNSHKQKQLAEQKDNE